MTSKQTTHTGIRRVITRLILCMAALVSVTGILGPWIIRSRLLYGFHFFIYGNMGKIIIFGAIALIIMAREKLRNLHVPPYDRRNLLFLPAAAISTALFFPVATALLKQPSFTANLPLSLSAHLLAVVSAVLVMCAALGVEFLTRLLKTLSREIFICMMISTVYYFAIFYIWRFWPILSTAVLYAVYFLFKPFFNPVVIIPPLGLYVKSFAVSIEQACSGIDSIFLFSSLYLLIGFVDWKQFNKHKLFLMLPPALIGLFAVNILRVFLLILAGVYTSPELTVTLFHTYLGMILFIIYFAIFWKLFYAWMKR